MLGVLTPCKHNIKKNMYKLSDVEEHENFREKYFHMYPFHCPTIVKDMYDTGIVWIHSSINDLPINSVICELLLIICNVKDNNIFYHDWLSYLFSLLDL